MNGEACPICDKGILTKKVVDETFEYNGSEITIPDYIIYECDICKEAIVDKETLRTSSKILKEHLIECKAHINK